MANFAINNSLAGSQQNMGASYKSALSVFATTGALRRGKVYDVLIGTDGTPADNAIDWDISRMTVDGTGTAATPNALDPADAAMLATAKVNYTAEPTVTAASSVWQVGVNQRASYRWVAAPGSELVYPATANNGLVLRAKSGGYTSTFTGAVMVQEQ
jgi:hypothetical protein